MNDRDYEAIGNIILFILVAVCAYLTGGIVAEIGKIIIAVMKVGIIWI